MLQNKDLKIFGHRGAAGLAFENSVSSIQKAIAIGVDGIEIDVWKTVDNELVVFHDTYLDRLTDKSGLIVDLDKAALDTIRLKNGEQIPKLIDVIELVKNSGVQLLVEVKSEDAFQPTIEILQVNIDNSEFIIGSFFHECIKNGKAAHPELQTAVMFEGIPAGLAQYLEEVNADYIVTSIETFNKKLLYTVAAQGRKLLFYTVNMPAEIALAKDAAPYGVITNYPDLFTQKK